MNRYDLILPGVLVLIILCMWIGMAVRKRKIRRLTEAIQTFLKTEDVLPVTTSGSLMGRLQTNVSELQHRLLQEREAARQEARNNTEYISDISHQLTTPLSGLRLYCEMDAVSPHAQKELVLISKMEKLIQNVQTLEKLRSDTYEMNFADCEIGEILRTVAGELQPLFPRKHISVVGSAVLRGDAEWLHEAVANVVKNACEHTAPNGTVAILAIPCEKTVEVTVEDNGGGVAPEELPKLFDRVHRTENAVPSSTGIGLAIAKAVVDKHHGTVHGENTDDGLKIQISLPIVDANSKI